MEHVRKEVALGSMFSVAEFERAFARFRELYNTAPTRVLCSPDVLSRFCVLYERSGDVALDRSAHLAYEGAPLCAGIVLPGTLVLEGEVDENRMGDW